jgi:hypothetical protein
MASCEASNFFESASARTLIAIKRPPLAAVDCFDGSTDPKGAQSRGGRCAGRAPPRLMDDRKPVHGHGSTRARGHGGTCTLEDALLYLRKKARTPDIPAIGMRLESASQEASGPSGLTGFRLTQLGFAGWIWRCGPRGLDWLSAVTVGLCRAALEARVRFGCRSAVGRVDRTSIYSILPPIRGELGPIAWVHRAL